MNTKIFVGGLSFSTTENSLEKELRKHGNVLSIRIVTCAESGKSKGYGFVSFELPEEADKAIEALNNQIFEDRRIGVKAAKERNIRR